MANVAKIAAVAHLRRSGGRPSNGTSVLGKQAILDGEAAFEEEAAFDGQPSRDEEAVFDQEALFGEDAVFDEAGSADIYEIPEKPWPGRPRYQPCITEPDRETEADLHTAYAL
jgi:hypothetical protein